MGELLCKSQNPSTAGAGRDLWASPSPTPPAQAGSPRAGCTGPRPGGAGISPEKETPQPLWAAWARAPSPSEGRSSSSGSAGTSCASVCAHCPLSFSLERLPDGCPAASRPQTSTLHQMTLRTALTSCLRRFDSAGCSRLAHKDRRMGRDGKAACRPRRSPETGSFVTLRMPTGSTGSVSRPDSPSLPLRAPTRARHAAQSPLSSARQAARRLRGSLPRVLHGLAGDSQRRPRDTVNAGRGQDAAPWLGSCPGRSQESDSNGNVVLLN